MHRQSVQSHCFATFKRDTHEPDRRNFTFGPISFWIWKSAAKKRLFEEAAQLLENEAELPNTNVFDCLFAREKLGSTGLGQGVAIPHGRHACVKKATGAFIRTKEPVAFDAPDGKPVSLIFILLVPEKRYRRTFGSLVQTGRQILSKSRP